MRRMTAVLLAAALMATTGAMAEDYQNPMPIPDHYPPIHAGADDYGIGDPFVMRFNGLYYLYASTCEDRVRVYTSANLIDWTYQGYCTQGRDVYFAYAPEVVYWRGDFYMVTSPGGNGHFVLRSESPLGPFTKITGNFGYSIDGSFYVLDDGQLILLHPDSQIIKQSYLDPDTLLPSGPMLSTGATLRHWTEGPGLLRRGDWHYLTFTGNHLCSTGYRVAFASRRDTPVGNYYQREESTLFINSVFGDDFKGLGHSSNAIGPDLDSLYTAYHSLVSLAGPARLYNLDRLLTNGGLLYTTGPTDTPMPVPAMPDVYGDIAGDPHDFAVTEDGWFATIDAADRFTQECNFGVEGGEAVWRLAEREGQEALLRTDGVALWLTVGNEEIARAQIPELGAEGRLHTLRVECTPDVLYAYIDGMRLLTLEQPGLTAERVGAYAGDGVAYSFVACTAQALGSGDRLAIKAIPGHFAAVHALNADTLPAVTLGTQEELAPVLGSADYAVRIAEAGEYCFDLTVRAADAGKPLSLSLDGEALLSFAVPAYGGKEAETFTFTTVPVALPQGDYTLTLAGEDVAVNTVSAFAHTPAQAMEYDFTTVEQRRTFIALGPFTNDMEQGTLSIRANTAGYALFGDPGNTDVELAVRLRLPKAGIGSSGILLRATHVSLYDAQVADSFYGYAVSMSALGLNLRRVRYGAVGQVEFVSVPEWKGQEEAELILRAEGTRITLSLPDSAAPLLVIEDASPFTHGQYGFFSTGKELEVLSMTVTPLEGGAAR